MMALSNEHTHVHGRGIVRKSERLDKDRARKERSASVPVCTSLILPGMWQRVGNVL